MNKLYQKNELFFVILWIVVYVIAFSAGDSFSASVGVEKSVTVLIGADAVAKDYRQHDALHRCSR